MKVSNENPNKKKQMRIIMNLTTTESKRRCFFLTSRNKLSLWWRTTHFEANKSFKTIEKKKSAHTQKRENENDE